MMDTPTYNVLVVEDDKINAFIVNRFLSDKYSVEVAQNGQEALELISSNKFDAVLLDINLGDDELDGVEVLKRIRKFENYSCVPIIATTAYALAGDRENFISSGFDDYLSKPIKREELLEKLKLKLQPQ